MAPTITDVFRLNVPTLLILPIYAYHITKTPIRRHKKPPVPLYMLMWEYGLVGAYIDLDETSIVPEPSGLIMKFTRDVFENKELTTSEFECLNDRLVDAHLVHEVWHEGEYVYYRMPIAENIREDVIAIIESRYTEVSPSYKMMVRTPVKVIPDWKENIGHYILLNNIPLGVVERHRILREMVEEEFDAPAPSDLFRKFSYELDVYIP